MDDNAKANSEFFNSFTDDNGQAKPANENGDGGQQSQQQAGASQDGGDANGGAEPVIELNQSAAPVEGQPPQGPEEQQKPFDFEAEFQKRFGVASTEASQILTEFPTLKQKAEAKSYLSAYGEEFDKLVSPVENGGKGLPAEVAIQYLSDTSKMDIKAYRAMIMKIENPTLTDSEIDSIIDHDYKLGTHAGVRDGDDDDIRSEKEKLGRALLKRDVENLRQKEKDFKAKMLEPYQSKGKIEEDAKKQQAVVAEASRKEAWKGKQTELLNNFKTFKIPFGEKKVVKDGKEGVEPAGWYHYAVTKEVKEKVAAEVARYVESNPTLMPDEKGTKFVTDTLFSLAMYQHAMPQMAHALIQLGNSKERDFFSKELNNPNFQQGNSRTFDHAAAGGTEDFYDWMMKQKPS